MATRHLGRVKPNARGSFGILAALLLGLVAMALTGCGSAQTASPATDDKTSGVGEQDGGTKEKPRSVPRVVPQPAEPVGFTGVFSTMDELQRCKATARVVVCASMGSGQVVRLDGSGASYEGEVARSFPAADPLGLGNEITTASGITCANTSRGIECARGGHGFVIGDSAAVIRRGSHEDRYEPTPVAPEPTGPDSQVYVCEDFGSQEEAQAVYEADPSDPSFLDDDFDGIACEAAFGLDQPAPVEVPEGGGCDPNYEGACIPISSSDLDCPEVGFRDFSSVGSDPHGFDGDGDGIACES